MSGTTRADENSDFDYLETEQTDGDEALGTITRLRLSNFLSYRDGTLEMDRFVALVGANASGKSNAVAALKLLHDIPVYGLSVAISRRGGFDQLRHRSQGHPYDPSIRMDFITPYGSDHEGFYELKLKAVGGKRYTVKSEIAEVWNSAGRQRFECLEGLGTSDENYFTRVDGGGKPELHRSRGRFRVAPGQSALSSTGAFSAFVVNQILSRIQTVEINTALVSDLQDASSTEAFEPDGSNTASLFDSLDASRREELVDELRAVVPGMDRIEVRHFADKMTLAFFQSVGTKTRREFFAKQMSDGTLRAFAIVLALLQPKLPTLTVIEEPEIAIHLGALRTLVDILEQHAARSQVLITTHSADIVDALDIDALRVVATEKGASKITRVAEHTRTTVRENLITPGDLMRANALDEADE